MTSSFLERKEVQCTTWRMHSTGPAWPVETQDIFFCHLAGWSAQTGLAIVHWIGCINTIKKLILILSVCTTLEGVKVMGIDFIFHRLFISPSPLWC